MNKKRINTQTISEPKYPCLFIPNHCVKDKRSKVEAGRGLTGWHYGYFTAREIITKLERGQTINPGRFKKNADGEYSHTVANWQGTHFICCDADNIVGIEKDLNGKEANPDGVPRWSEPDGLSKQFPNLKDRVFAVGQSVSSMSADKPPLHRRYRLIFAFDAEIQSREDYDYILSKLAAEFPIIPAKKRSPAQPVFGNARADDTGKFTIVGNELKLAAWQEPEREKRARKAQEKRSIEKAEQNREKNTQLAKAGTRTATAESVSVVEAALALVDPDVSYDDWRNIVFGLKDACIPIDVAIQWSRGDYAKKRASRFDSEADRRIRSLYRAKAPIGRKRTIGTVYRIALDNGFRFPASYGT